MATTERPSTTYEVRRAGKIAPKSLQRSRSLSDALEQGPTAEEIDARQEAISEIRRRNVPVPPPMSGAAAESDRDDAVSDEPEAVLIDK
jgi:hypothetical protein